MVYKGTTTFIDHVATNRQQKLNKLRSFLENLTAIFLILLVGYSTALFALDIETFFTVTKNLKMFKKQIIKAV